MSYGAYRYSKFVHINLGEVEEGRVHAPAADPEDQTSTAFLTADRSLSAAMCPIA